MANWIEELPPHWYAGVYSDRIIRCDGQRLYAQFHPDLRRAAENWDRIMPLKECKCSDNAILAREIDKAIGQP